LAGESLRHDALWMMGGQGGAALLQAAYFVLIGRALGSAQYGAFVGVVAMVSVGSQFSGLGMEMLLLREVSREPAQFCVSWGRALQVTLAGAALLLLAAVTLGHLIFAREIWPLLPYVAVADGLFGRLLQVASRALQATRQMRWAAVLPVGMSAARAGVAAVFFRLAAMGRVGATAQSWVAMYWTASAAAALLALGLLTWKLGWPRFQRIRLGELTEGLSFAVSSSSISAYNDLDKTLLVSAGQMEAAGIYGAAYRVVDVATMPIYSLFTAATPRYFRAGARSIAGSIAGSVAETEALMGRLLKRALPAALGLGALLFLVAAGLPWALGPSFAGSVAALRWLCLLPVLRLLHYTWGTAVTACTSQWRRTAAQVTAAGLNLGLCAWWIPAWSWRGAAWASLATDAALAAMSFAIWRHWAGRRDELSVVSGQSPVAG
jgi:O-antigen/teichoic acid export membrane protein